MIVTGTNGADSSWQFGLEQLHQGDEMPCSLVDTQENQNRRFEISLNYVYIHVGIQIRTVTCV